MTEKPKRVISYRLLEELEEHVQPLAEVAMQLQADAKVMSDATKTRKQEAKEASEIVFEVLDYDSGVEGEGVGKLYWHKTTKTSVDIKMVIGLMVSKLGADPKEAVELVEKATTKTTSAYPVFRSSK